MRGDVGRVVRNGLWYREIVQEPAEEVVVKNRQMVNRRKDGTHTGIADVPSRVRVVFTLTRRQSDGTCASGP